MTPFIHNSMSGLNSGHVSVVTHEVTNRARAFQSPAGPPTYSVSVYVCMFVFTCVCVYVCVYVCMCMCMCRGVPAVRPGPGRVHHQARDGGHRVCVCVCVCWGSFTISVSWTNTIFK